MDDIQSWWEVPSIAHFCSLFRAAFNLLDFDIEELEEALLTDGAEDSGSSLLQELIVRLLCGCLGNSDISTFNYQMFLRRLFRQKCQEYGRENPFNTDIDFQFLPLRTKVEILHSLCDFRLDADDVADLLKNLESDSLRVEPLGHDENNSAYWYFYGTRLYREDYPKSKRKTKEKRRKGKEEKKRKKQAEWECRSGSGGVWQVVCFTELDWDNITEGFRESRSKAERELYHTLSEDFLPEIPRLFAEKERLQRKRMMEYQPRRQSSRIEKLKQQKEEEEKTLQGKKEKDEKEHKKQEEKKEEKKERSRQSQNNRTNRARRGLKRSRSRTNSECGSSGSVMETPVETKSAFVGRQTNNSLSSATGQIVIQGLRRKLRSSQVFRQTEEDLQTGMYKILESIKNHEDAWPFMEPVDEEYAPRYYSIITKPMDLQRMEDKLDEGEYLSFADFRSDFQLIVDNCRRYNGTDNEYTEMVGNLQEAFQLAVDRYLESEPSSDEEVAVEFPQNKVVEKLLVSRSAGRKKKSPSPSADEDVLTRTPSPPPTPASPQSIHSADKSLKEEKIEKKEEENVEGMADESDDHSGKGKKKRDLMKNPAAIEALELATEQTLKDINKWLDDTPRFSEFSSASNSPSHLASAEEYESLGSRIDSEYRHSLKLDKPHRTKESKDSKRRLNKDSPKQFRRREVQRTIERLQPGKSKGNLLSIIQGPTKMTEEDMRSSCSGVRADEAMPKLSLGTVLGSDVLGFVVGQNNHSFEKKADVSVVVTDEPPKPLLIKPKTPELPEKLKRVEEKVVKKNKEEKCASEASCKETRQEKAMPNLSAWFKAFGAPKAANLLKKRAESMDIMLDEERQDVCSSFDACSHATEKHVSVVVENKSMEEPDISCGAVVPRQRKASTGSSMSERSSFSQDLLDPVDGSSPRLSLDEQLGPYSPRLDEGSKFASYPPLHPVSGPIRVGFYQDTSSTLQKSSPEKSPKQQLRTPPPTSPPTPPPASLPPPPPPTYTPRMYPPHDPGGFIAFQSSSSALPPLPLMQYYDTSKPLTDQYQAARTQSSEEFHSENMMPGKPSPAPISLNSSHQQEVDNIAVHTVQKPSASVFPVKKRLYSETGGEFPPSSRIRFSPPADKSTLSNISKENFATQKSSSDGELLVDRQDSPVTFSLHILKENSVAEKTVVSTFQKEEQQSHINQQVIKMNNVKNTDPCSPRRQECLAVCSQEQKKAAFVKTSRQIAEAEKSADLGVPQSSASHRSSSPPFVEAYKVKGKTKSVATFDNRTNGQRRSLLQDVVVSNSVIQRPQQSEISSAPVISHKGNPGNDTNYQRTPFSSVEPLALTHTVTQRTVVDQFPSTFFGEKALRLLPQPSGPATVAYSRTMPDLPSVLSNKVPFTSAVQDLSLSPVLPATSSSSVSASSFTHSELSSLPSKLSTPYNRPSVDLQSFSPSKVPAAASFTRPADYTLLAPKTIEAVPVPKSSRKRKNKQTAPSNSEASAVTNTATSTAFQQYVGLKNPNVSEPAAISLKTASCVPGSAFNFGPGHSGLGLYSDKEGYAGFLEELRSAQSSFYMATADLPRDKLNQTSGAPPASSFPYLSHPPSTLTRPPTYPLPQAFMDPAAPSPPALYQQLLQRHQQDLLQGLLGTTAGYPATYHPAFDALNRHSWL